MCLNEKRCRVHGGDGRSTSVKTSLSEAAPLYLSTKRSWLVRYQQKPSKAVRMFTAMLVKTEHIVSDSAAIPHKKICAWWMLVQSWSTLRFRDHRGTKPYDVTFRAGSLAARSNVSYRMVQESTCCFPSAKLADRGLDGAEQLEPIILPAPHDKLRWLSAW